MYRSISDDKLVDMLYTRIREHIDMRNDGSTGSYARSLVLDNTRRKYKRVLLECIARNAVTCARARAAYECYIKRIDDSSVYRMSMLERSLVDCRVYAHL